MKSRAKQKASRNQKSRTTTRQPRNDKEQSKLFIKTAREIGADEEHSATDRQTDGAAGKDEAGAKKGSRLMVPPG
jgi:hypothetical protein